MDYLFNKVIAYVNMLFMILKFELMAASNKIFVKSPATQSSLNLNSLFHSNNHSVPCCSNLKKIQVKKKTVFCQNVFKKSVPSILYLLFLG